MEGVDEERPTTTTRAASRTDQEGRRRRRRRRRPDTATANQTGDQASKGPEAPGEQLSPQDQAAAGIPKAQRESHDSREPEEPEELEELEEADEYDPAAPLAPAVTSTVLKNPDDNPDAAEQGFGCCSAMLLKWSSLSFLTVSTVFFANSFRYARLQPGPPFSNLSLVVSSELLKVLLSFALLLYEHGAAGSISSLKRMACSKHTLLMGVPGMVYCLQNALFFAGQSNLSVSLYQVVKQATILCTALFSTILLQQRLGLSKWLALCLLCAGVATVAVRGDNATRGTVPLGLMYTLAACAANGVASVYTELMLKRASFTIGERNLQLAVYGTLWGIAGMVAVDPHMLVPNQYFQGYKLSVWSVIFQQSVMGIATAFALKYASSVLKCVAKAMGMILAVISSRLLFHEGPSLTAFHFQAGLFLAIWGTVAFQFGFGSIFTALGLDILWQRRTLVLPREKVEEKSMDKEPSEKDEEMAALVPEPVLQRKSGAKE